MNSSSIMRRTLPLILVLVLIIGIAVSCTLVTKKKTAPTISNPEEVYLQTDILTIKNKDVYDVLNIKYGYSLVMDLIDRRILENVDGKNYLAAVTNEEIDQYFKDKYADFDEFPEEDKEKQIQKVYDEIYFGTGLKNRAEIDESIRLELARRYYAKDKIIEASKAKEDYFKDSDYTAELKNSYKPDVAAVVIGYNSQKEVEIALRQLGVKLSNDEKKWVKTVEGDFTVDGEALTLEEIKQTFIDLYNSANTHTVPNYPSSQLSLQIDDHYSVIDGVITFNHDNLNHESRLVYTQQNLKKLGIENLVYDELKQLVEEPEGKTYTVTYNKQYGEKYYLVMKIESAPKKELSTIIKDDMTVKEEITNKLIEKILDEKSNINKEMMKLRRERNLVIYDPIISLNYTFQDEEFKETKKSSKKVIAAIDDFEITADELFAKLVKLYGPTYVTEELLLNYMLNSEFNDFYDAVKDKFLTKEAKTKYNDEFAELKLGIKQQYSSYAQVLTMEQYLLSTYGVRTLDELKYQLFYRDIIEDFRKDFADIEKNWEKYEQLMNANLEKFFDVKGIHLLIGIYDSETNKPINPEEWSEYQVELAKELYDVIKGTLKNEVVGSKTYSLIMGKIEEDFKNSPRLVAGYDVDSNEAKPLYDENVLYPEVDYKYSKYKSAGLTLTFQDLGTITPGAMVKPFEDAVRYMWKQNEEAGHHGNNKPWMYNNPEDPYLETEFGFHILVATNTTAYRYANKDEKTLPTKQNVLDFFDTAKVKELSEDVKSAINANFLPIYNERKGYVNEENVMQANHADIYLLSVVEDLVSKTNLSEEAKNNIVFYITAKLRDTEDSLRYKE